MKRKIIYCALALFAAGVAQGAPDLFRVMFRAECMTLGRAGKELIRSTVTERTIVAESLGLGADERAAPSGYALVYNTQEDSLQVVDPLGRVVNDVLQLSGGTSFAGERYAHRYTYLLLPDGSGGPAPATNIVGTAIITERGLKNTTGWLNDRPAIFGHVQLALTDGVRLGMTNSNVVTTNTPGGTNQGSGNLGGGITTGTNSAPGIISTNVAGTTSDLSNVRTIDIIGTGGATGITGTGGATGVTGSSSTVGGGVTVIGSGGATGVTGSPGTTGIGAILPTNSTTTTPVVGPVVSPPPPIVTDTNVSILPGTGTGGTTLTPPSQTTTPPVTVGTGGTGTNVTSVTPPIPGTPPTPVVPGGSGTNTTTVTPPIPVVTGGNNTTTTPGPITAQIGAGMTNGVGRAFYLNRTDDNPRSKVYIGIFMTQRRFVPGLNF